MILYIIITGIHYNYKIVSPYHQEHDFHKRLLNVSRTDDLCMFISVLKCLHVFMLGESQVQACYQLKNIVTNQNEKK
jgi:hypothetical protein